MWNSKITTKILWVERDGVRTERGAVWSRNRGRGGVEGEVSKLEEYSTYHSLSDSQYENRSRNIHIQLVEFLDM